MSTDTPATSLYPALLAAMREFNPVVKNKQNPHLKNFYADLSAVLEAVTEPLASHGLLIVQRFSSDQGTPILITEIVHAESGQSIASALPVICKDPTDPQKLGGAITYARRYSLVAILSLTAEDDDGNAASKPAPPRQQPQQQPRTTSTGGTANPNVTAQFIAPPASNGTPAPAAVHPLLATIRDDTADPKKRRTALHNYYMTATTKAELGRCAAQVEHSGLPLDDLDRARYWHVDRISGTPAAAPAAPPLH